MSTSQAPRRFQFLREIASGGFGSVYLAKVIHADGFSRLVAVKLLHKRWSENLEVASRMRDEARLLGWLRHRNIVEVLDLTFIDGRSAVVMEYLEAIDAKGLIDRCVANGIHIPISVVCEFGAACGSALDAAYNRPPYAGEKPLRVIHRDIKPSNIMLDSHGTVKVLDFGVARAEFDTREAKTAELSFGSLEYMPPERLFFEPESPASDVYSLGSMLYELITLEKLGKARLRQSEQDRFVQERLQVLFERRRLPPELVEELEPMLIRMLAFDESDRPTSAELVGKLRALGKRTGEESVEEWAGKHVLSFIDALRAGETGSGEGGTLLGQTVTEDAAVVHEGTHGGEPEEITGTATEVFRPIDFDGPESAEYTTSTGHDEARWSALKEATLASLNETGELSKSQLPASLGGRGAEATLPGRATPKPMAARGPTGTKAPPLPRSGPTLAPIDLTPGGPRAVRTEAEEATVSLAVDADEETMADGAPTVVDLPRKRSGPPPAVTQRIQQQRQRASTSTPPVSQGRRSVPPQVVAFPPPPPVEEEPGLLSLELLMATGMVGAAGIGTFLFVLIIGIPVVAFALGVTPFGGTEVPVAAPKPEPEPTPGPEPTPRPEPTPTPEPTPGPDPAQPTPDAPRPGVEPGGSPPVVAENPAGLTFTSGMPGTTKMMARCDSGGGQGETSVALGALAAKQCTVTALDGARNRRTALVKDVKPVSYRCFVGATDTCEPNGP